MYSTSVDDDRAGSQVVTAAVVATRSVPLALACAPRGTSVENARPPTVRTPTPIRRMRASILTPLLQPERQPRSLRCIVGQSCGSLLLSRLGGTRHSRYSDYACGA